MATKKQTTSDRLEDVSCRLTALGSVIQLCAFAAEARRTLDDIEGLRTALPDFGQTVSRLIDAPSEWTTHEDVLGLVLKSAAHEIGELQNLIDEVQP